MVFVGEYEHSIDTKNRLAIASELRAMARRAGAENEEGNVVFYVAPGEDEDCLCLYTEQMFIRRAQQLDESMRDPDELLAYEEMYFGQSRRVETDAQGRIRLPDNLLQDAGLGREVVLVGVKDHIRIRDREQWLARKAQSRADGKRKMLNPRRMLR